MVDWHVMQVERFGIESVIFLQGVRLNQSPCDTRLGTKVAVDWECDVLLVCNVVDTAGRFFVDHHDVFIGSNQHDFTSVSREAW